MLNRKSIFGAIAIAALFAAYPHVSIAGSFKSSDFLTWNKKSQAFYIEASIGMASLIAAQNNKSQAKCIDDWYYPEEAAKNAFILETMKRVPDYHPRGVILAVIEKQCTPLVYK